LVEVAALTQALKKMGHDPAKDFNDRLIAYMTQQAGPAAPVSIRPLSMDSSSSPRP
jgi:HPr kinase/phosphorylase